MGRMGNNMFQIAATIGVARKNKIEYAFESLPDLPELPKGINIHNWNENGFHYQEVELTKDKHWRLVGYFQSEKYFLHCADEIKAVFAPTQTYKDIINDFKSQHEGFETVGVHVRRGDYVNLQDYHPVLSLQYYVDAFKHFNERNTRFVVYSDDIDWCRSTMAHLAKDIIFINEGQYCDFNIGANCNHNIIANSSYSWWQAWLNDNKEKKVIAPKKWFGKKYSHFNTSDLIPDKWIKI